jgi:hypothetical protein
MKVDNNALEQAKNIAIEYGIDKAETFILDNVAKLLISATLALLKTWWDNLNTDSDENNVDPYTEQIFRHMY